MCGWCVSAHVRAFVFRQLNARRDRKKLTWTREEKKRQKYHIIVSKHKWNLEDWSKNRLAVEDPLHVRPVTTIVRWFTRTCVCSKLEESEEARLDISRDEFRRRQMKTSNSDTNVDCVCVPFLSLFLRYNIFYWPIWMRVDISHVGTFSQIRWIGFYAWSGILADIVFYLFRLYIMFE